MKPPIEDLSGLEKTKLHEHVWLPLESILKNKDNPNEMSQKAFSLLVENIMSKGVTEPIEVREVESESETPLYRIISGHHRYDACSYLKWTTVPCVINRDPELDDDKEMFQMVKMNAIHGEVNPDKFVKLYEKALVNHSPGDLQALFGYSDEKEFEKLLKETEKNLPEELKDAFKEAAKEVKTMDDLAELLQRLFSDFGDTLSYGYMLFDYGGKYSVWIRMLEGDLSTFKKFAGVCVGRNKAIDDVVRNLFKYVMINDALMTLLLDNTKDRDMSQPNHLELKKAGFSEPEKVLSQGEVIASGEVVPLNPGWEDQATQSMLAVEEDMDMDWTEFDKEHADE